MTTKTWVNINTCLYIDNGVDIIEIARVLQKFTSQYLIIKNDKLYSINNFNEIRPAYKLIRYDRCFQLLHQHTRNFLYCFNKDLADFLCSTPINKFPVINKNTAQLKSMTTILKPMEDNNVNNNVNNNNNNINRDRDRDRDTDTEGGDSDGNDSDVDTEDRDSDGDDSEGGDSEGGYNISDSDTMSESRSNATLSIAKAIQRRREQKKIVQNKRKQNNNTDAGVYNKDTQKVCSIMAEVLKNKSLSEN